MIPAGKVVTQEGAEPAPFDCNIAPATGANHNGNVPAPFEYNKEY